MVTKKAIKKLPKAKKASKLIQAVIAPEAVDVPEAIPVTNIPKALKAPEASNVPEAIKRKPGRPRKWTDEKIEEVGNELWEWFNQPGNMVYIKFLAERGLHYETIARFQSVSKPFCEIIKKCNILQEAKLIEAGLSKEYSRSQMFAIACLNNKHGWAHKQESKSTNITTVRIEDLAKMKQLPDEQLTDSLRWLTEPRRGG